MIAIEFQIGGNDKVLFRNSDYSGYELCWQRSQKGLVVWTPEKYYGSISSALAKIMELKIKATEVRSLAELISATEKARKEVLETYRFKLDVAG